VSGVLRQIDSICSVHTFGYGSEPDPEYLKDIAEEGNGMFYKIDTANDIPLAFADCLGGLLSVVAQHIILTIESPKCVKISDVQSTYPSRVIDPRMKIEIHVEDIYSEEEKDFLVTMEMEKVDGAIEKWNILDCDVKYINVIEKKSIFKFHV